ncbi:MAG: RluA family pseudouridine synthase [Dehalococcoidia bacterium]|nr:RluA family pseudouridine synthase [Dehalococcoidia bacterium]
MSVPRRRFTATEAGRIDRVVAAALPELSRSQARRLIEDGAVAIEGAIVTRPGHATSAGATIEVELPVVPDLDLLAADVPLRVLYEDEETLVIDKTPGLIVHPAPGVTGVTLINAVRARYPEVREIDGDRPGVVHRLDRDTSGAMVFAKTETAAQVLKDQWRERETLKRYLALVEGEVDPPEGAIEALLGPDPTNPRRRAVVEDGQSARSLFRVLEQYGAEAALVEVEIHTGRTHQIRVHMAAIGHPVCGDALYGHRSPLIERQALHAIRLGFTLASTGEWREFEAPVPDDINHAIGTLRARHGVEPARAEAST